jgi:uncharacterized membrane protein YkvA (DUF1232 family)
MEKRFNYPPPSRPSWFRAQMARRRQDLEYVVWQIRVLGLAIKHPQVPWHAKLVAGCAVGYLVSPIQIIPTFIPVIGQLDDLFVLFIGMKLLRKWTPERVLAECETRARSSSSAQPLTAQHVVLPSIESDIPAA